MDTSGADPGFFLGGGALVSCSTSTPINHIVLFFFCRIPVVLENRRSSQGGVRTPCTLPLDPPLHVHTWSTISSPWTSSLSRIACNTSAIFFLEFLILGMMYTQLAGDVTWRESLLYSHTNLSYLGEHLKVGQARSLHACLTRMLYHDRLESTNSAKMLKIFNIYSSLGL